MFRKTKLEAPPVKSEVQVRVRPPVPSAASSSGRRFSDPAGEADTTIGAAVQIKGGLTGSGNMAIHGRIEGDVGVEGLLVVGKGASIRGDVSATDAIVEGDLVGNLTVQRKLEMRATGSVIGDIRAASMAMSEGCRFEGKVATGAGAGASAAPLSFREKRTSDVSTLAETKPESGPSSGSS